MVTSVTFLASQEQGAGEKTLTSALADANFALIELGDKILRKHIDLQWVGWVEAQVSKIATGAWSLPVTPSWKVMMLRDDCSSKNAT